MLRDADHVMGRDGLASHNADKVRVGNALALSVASLVRWCIRHGVNVAVENPVSSLLWQLPVYRALESSSVVRVVDFCQYGTAWRKRTRVSFWGLSTVKDFRVCSGRGICSRSGYPHLQLEGQRLCRQAQVYPAALASIWADICIDDVLNRKGQRC